MLRRRRTALAFGVLASLAIVVSCREPTQVTLRVTSGEPCSKLGGVQVVVAPDVVAAQDRFEHHVPVAVTRECNPGDGLVGTLVVTPGGQSATIVIAAGVEVDGLPAPDPTTCADATVAKRCIIARRNFSFLEHTSLSLPIVLDHLCVGQTCDPASTCFKGGCVSASVTCNGSDCGLPQEHPGEGSGGAGEAGTSDGAYDAELDGMSFDGTLDAGGDGTTIVDGMADADTGGFDGNAPSCDQMGTLNCDPGQGSGVGTSGKCANPSDKTYTCCHCTCPVGGAIVSCDITLANGSSCTPPCP